MDAAARAALATAKRIHLTTYGATGRAGTVPVWFMVKDGSLYFTTKRGSLKAKRIRATGRATVHVGAAAGPAFEARAELVEDRPDLEDAILAAYRRKYPVVVPLFMGPFIRRRLRRKENVVVRLTPSGV
ncbi:MAG: pyridoxamine 5'-phosphate oxidase family protein [Candidatus Rokubacteria bacterium]|nr:pyridoxamine 5'-phosphate oxidase family protein [Candidatus Rokubacteria bacterium]